MTVKLTLITVDLWPLLSQVWQEPVCLPPSSEPRDPPPGTHLSPTAGWCRSLRSPEMQSEFTYKDQKCTNMSRKSVFGGSKKRRTLLESAGWTQWHLSIHLNVWTVLFQIHFSVAATKKGCDSSTVVYLWSKCQMSRLPRAVYLI